MFEAFLLASRSAISLKKRDLKISTKAGRIDLGTRARARPDNESMHLDCIPPPSADSNSLVVVVDNYAVNV